MQPIFFAPAPTLIDPNAGATGASSAASTAYAVTPETFILMIQNRLDDCDAQVETVMQRMEERTKEAKNISRQLEALHAISQHSSAVGSSKHIHRSAQPGNEKEHDLVEFEGRKWNVDALLHEVDASGVVAGSKDGDGLPVYKTSSIEKAISQKETELRKVNSGNELDMVNLQSMMQQRSQVIQLGSNLLKSFNEAQETIVRNMG